MMCTKELSTSSILAMKTVIVLINLLIFIYSKKHCRRENRILNYFKLKTCHRSTLPVIFWANVDKIEECIKVAKEKKGLAFNFSPIEARQATDGFIISCQVLGCPEIGNSHTLVQDIGYDYYSVFGNLRVTENAICIKNIGLFDIFPQKQNYTRSIDLCQGMGAELADISSEIRTKYLSIAVNETLADWYKVAYVGLDDMEQEGYFVTSFDLPLSCTTFRSWAPGHPISSTEEHNCVVIDDNKMWRVVDCNRKLPVLCEFYPQKPEKVDFKVCKNITDRIKRLKCTKKLEDMDEMIKNMTRLEQCAILNAVDDNKNHTEVEDQVQKL